MAFTYLALNFIFIAVVVTALWRRLKRPTKPWLITLVALLLLTLVFDNIMIWASLFHYEPLKILGIHIGLAPIEDFFYAVLAALIVPVLWDVFRPKTDSALLSNLNKEEA